MPSSNAQIEKILSCPSMRGEVSSVFPTVPALPAEFLAELGAEELAMVRAIRDVALVETLLAKILPDEVETTA
jgi:hypothetical protein